MTYPGATTAVLDGTVAGVPVPQQGPVGLLVRLALVLGLLLGWGQLADMPVSGSLDELLADLERGEVTHITLDRPAPESAASGDFGVLWEGAGRPGRATYQYDSEFAGADVVVRLDEAERIREAAERSPTAVEILEVRDFYEGGTTWYLHGIAWFVVLLVLVAGPQPRLATKWGWFWLMYLVPPAAVALVVLEPVPLWRGEAPSRARRLTGGWALLLGLFATGLFSATPVGELFR